MRAVVLSLTFALAACASSLNPPPGAPPPPRASAAPAPPSESVDSVASGVTVPPEPPPAPPRAGDVVVPSARERPVPAPQADPRSVNERMADIRAWDQCVLRVQSQGESNPMRPTLSDPEELCSRSLGMSSRTAVPNSRQH